MPFLYASLMGIALLYGPGYLFFRGLSCSRIMAICCAPLYSVCLYASLPIAYYELEIACDVLSVGVPTLVVALVVFCLGRVRASRGDPTRRECPLGPRDLPPMRVARIRVSCDVMLPLVYIAVAALVCALVWWRVMPATNALNQRFDNLMHINLVRTFYDSGKWSSLHTSLNLASPPQMRPDPSSGSFYPSAWNCVVVLVCLTSGVDLMVCVNVVVTLSIVVLFPLGMYALLRVLLPGQTWAVALGAVAVTGFSHWPWLCIATGPLFPNQFGISLQGSALALLICLVEELPGVRRVATCAICSVVSFVALALSHPSTIFASYVVMVWYGASRVWGCAKGPKRLVALLGYGVAVVAVWVMCYNLPALQSTIGYVENARDDLADAMADLLTMRYGVAQVGVVLAAGLGSVCLATRKRLRWLFAVVAFFTVGYIAVRVDWWTIKHWVAGLWYSDKRRMTANLAVFLMPIVALGLGALVRGGPVSRRIGDEQGDEEGSACAGVVELWLAKIPRGIRVAAFGVLVALIYLPSMWVPVANAWVETPLGSSSRNLDERYHEVIYHPDEMAFVDEVRATIPPGSLVINFPADGSSWAYGFNGLDVLYRHIRFGAMTPEADLIRKRLCDYAQDKAVRDAVKSMGVRYVLQLDKGVSYADGTWLWQFEEAQMADWRGILRVNDDTPGFQTILARGDEMRLYLIDDAGSS